MSGSLAVNELPAPQVSGYLGLLRIELGHSGADVEVHASTLSGFAPDSSTLVDTVCTCLGGAAVFTRAEYGVPYFVKTVARDRDGIVTAESLESTATAARLLRPSELG